MSIKLCPRCENEYNVTHGDQLVEIEVCEECEEYEGSEDLEDSIV